MSVTKLPMTVTMLLILYLITMASASYLEPKIVGGTSTTIDKYPYQVSIFYNDKLACGGSIIHAQWILTAAHCVEGGRLPLFKIRVGSTYHDQGGTLIKDISLIVSHEWYDDEIYDYDVGLIKLSTPLSFGKNVKAVPLATSSAIIKAGSMTVVSGWGRTSEKGSYSKVLQTVSMPIVDQEACKKIYGPYRVTSNMLCAGYPTGAKDTCHGDSGGPLIYNGVQIGIVSWGAQCAKAGYPGVYTRISAIRSWITKRANV